MNHDQNCKNLILDYPRQALDFFAPEEAALIPADARILPVRQEQVQERLGERFRELDTPLLVEWQEGREAVLFLLEEESDPRRFSIYRLAHYCLDLAELLTLERVVPVVIFLKPGSHQQKLVLAGGQMTYLHFCFVTCDLGRLPVDDYLQSRNIVARLNLPNMQHLRERRVGVYLRAQEGLAELEPDPEKRLKYIDFIAQYANLSEAEQAEYERLLAQSAYQEAIMGPVQKAIQEGIQQGIQQGRQEGLREGLREGLLEGIELGLEIKFGLAGLALMPEIQSIRDPGVLHNIKETLKIANSPEEIRHLCGEQPTSH